MTAFQPRHAFSLIAGLLGLAVAALYYINVQDARRQTEVNVLILAGDAAKDGPLQVGRRIEPSMIATAVVLRDTLAAAPWLIEDDAGRIARSALVGRRLVRDVLPGSFLRREYVFGPASNPMELSIATGARALALSVDGRSSVAQMVSPGSRVDVLGVTGDGAAARMKVVLEDVKIIAVGAWTSLESWIDAGRPGYGTVTVEATLEKLEDYLVAARTVDDLTLALRNPCEGAAPRPGDRCHDDPAEGAR